MRLYPTLRPALVLLIFSALLGLPSQCRAGLLVLEPDPNGPALLAVPGEVNYVRDTGRFTAHASVPDDFATLIFLSSLGIPGELAIFSAGTSMKVDLFVNLTG